MTTKSKPQEQGITRYEVRIDTGAEDYKARFPRQVIEADSPLAAIASFQGTSTMVDEVRAADPVKPLPPPMLRNYEKDPDAEVSDGWLSNIAADISNARAQLESVPEYHIKRTEFLVCSCGREIAPRVSKFGAYYPCDCGAKWNPNTKKAAALRRIYRYSCGEEMTVTVNNFGVPYNACPKCHTQDVARMHRPVGDLVRGYR